jgi:hypothetical protein
VWSTDTASVNLAGEVRRGGQPSARVPGPHVRVASGSSAAVGRRECRTGVDDGGITEDPDLDVVDLELRDVEGPRRALEESLAGQDRAVRERAAEIVGQLLVEPPDIRPLDGIDVLAIETRTSLTYDVVLLCVSIAPSCSPNSQHGHRPCTGPAVAILTTDVVPGYRNLSKVAGDPDERMSIPVAASRVSWQLSEARPKESDSGGPERTYDPQ